MKIYLIALTLSFILNTTLLSEYRIATVHFQKAFVACQKIKRIEQQFNKTRAELQQRKSQKYSRIFALRDEMTDMRTKQKTENVSDSEKKDFVLKYYNIYNELRKLEQKKEAEIKVEEKKLDNKEKKHKADLLKEAHKKLQKIAQEQGFDIVFDTSGTSTNQFPPLLHAESTTDLTSDLIEKLNK